MRIDGKRVVVVGAGTSGAAAARLARARGAEVVLTDTKELDAWSEAARALVREGVTPVAGGHAAARLAGADLVVVSPGVPPFAELAEAERAGVPIWGEVELSVRELRHPAELVAIGGTNGKSTTTELVGALLAAGGARTFVGGNLGEPLALHADEPFERVVLEVSSYQMERVDAFHPRVAVLLNVTPDHLDRYPSFEAYAAAKGNMFLRQTPRDLAVVPAGDAGCAREAARGKGRVVTFGPGGDVGVDALHVHARGARYARAELALTGGHNALNVAAALAAIEPFDVPEAQVREVLARFRGLPHRTALVAELAGVRWYDDSKGTNVGAAVTALLMLVEPRAVLVAGGRDKGGSYGPLVEALRGKGRAAVLIGEAAELIGRALASDLPDLPVRRAASMDEAVRVARELAHPGDAVLLSPACSSFDMFRDYKHRGDEFVRAVKSLEATA